MKWILLVLPLGLSAMSVPMPLQMEPWLGDPYAFQAQVTYGYSHYPNVQNASVPLDKASNDQLVAGSIEWCLQNWDFELEAEFVNTPRQPWGYRAAALQLRYLWLDDVACDPVSLLTGCIVQNTNSRSLRDVSCPYHANMNFELNATLGKEWCSASQWLLRGYGFLGVGMGNRGSPWLRGQLSFQMNLESRHQGQLFALGYFGFGDETRVDTAHFRGWAKFRHQSIDLGGSYRYLFDCWGNLALDLSYRVFARTFPKQLFAISLTYTLPFSAF